MKRRATIFDQSSTTNFGPKFSSTVSLQDTRAVRDLAKFGVVPRKTGKERAPGCLKNNPHFWRGVIDGDGSVGLALNRGRKYPYVLLGGTRNLCTAFSAFASRRLGLARPKLGNCRGLSTVRWNGEPARRLLALLYLKAPTALDRKARLARAALGAARRRPAKIAQAVRRSVVAGPVRPRRQARPTAR